MLVLFPNSWNGKAQLLQGGKTVIAAKPFTHCSVLLLMSEQGLLLRAGSQQSVSVRVAAEYLQPSTPLTGNWSKSCFTINITPRVNLLLHSPASHTWGASSLPSPVQRLAMPLYSQACLKPTSHQL
jgi:hypothetical protein